MDRGAGLLPDCEESSEIKDDVNIDRGHIPVDVGKKKSVISTAQPTGKNKQRKKKCVDSKLDDANIDRGHIPVDVGKEKSVISAALPTGKNKQGKKRWADSEVDDAKKKRVADCQEESDGRVDTEANQWEVEFTENDLIFKEVVETREEMKRAETQVFRLQKIRNTVMSSETMLAVPESQNMKLYLVLDTCVVLHGVHSIKRVKDLLTAKLGDRYSIAVPWLLIQEIDHIKDKPQTKGNMDIVNRARAAVNLIDDWIESHDTTHLYFQKSQDSAAFHDEFQGFRVEQCDDKIIHFCLQLRQRNPYSTVVLLSVDKNFRSKTKITGFPAYSTKMLFDWLTKASSTTNQTSVLSDFEKSESHPWDITPAAVVANLDTWTDADNLSDATGIETLQTPADLPAVKQQFVPLGDGVLLELSEDEKKKGDVVTPNVSYGKVREATVVAVGPGLWSSKGNLIPMSVVVGDRVLLPENVGTSLVFDEEEYLLVRNQEILGKFGSRNSNI